MSIPTIKVGDKVLVIDKKEEYGECIVKYIGTVNFDHGKWVGLELSKPVGDNDGSSKGVRYFTCKQNYGVFVKYKSVIPIVNPKPQKKTVLKTSSSSNITINNEINALKEENSALKERIKELESQVNILREGRKSLMTSSEEFINQEKEFKEQAKNLQEQLDTVIEENEALRRSLKEYENKYEKDVKKLKEELDNVTKHYTDEISKLKEDYEDRIANLNDDLELIMIDKEMAIVNHDSLQKEYEILKSEYDILNEYKKAVEEREENRRKSIESGNVDIQSNEDVQILISQNERLKAAIVKMKEISVSESQEHEKTLAELENLKLMVIPSLEEKCIKLEEQLLDYEEQIEVLKINVDESKDLQDRFEELLEQKLDLEDEVKELKKALEELESLKQLSEEIEAVQSETEKKLMSEIYQKEVLILDQEDVINNMKKTIEIQNEKIEQLSKHITKQTELINELNKKKMVENEQEQEEVTEDAEEKTIDKDDTINMILRKEARKNALKLLSDKLNEVKRKQSTYHLKFIQMYIPDKFLTEEDENIQFILLLMRIHEKSEIAFDHIRDMYSIDQLERELVQSENFIMIDEIDFIAIKICDILLKLSLNSLYFMEICKTCDDDMYKRLRKIANEFKSYEGKLDNILLLLKREEIDGTFPFEEYNSILERLEVLFDKYVVDVNIPAKSFYVHKLQSIFQNAISIYYYITLLYEKGINVSSISMKGVRILMDFSRKLIKSISTSKAMIYSDTTKLNLNISQNVLKIISDFSVSLHEQLVIERAANPEVIIEKETEKCLEALDILIQKTPNFINNISANISKMDLYLAGSMKVLYDFKDNVENGNFEPDDENVVSDEEYFDAIDHKQILLNATKIKSEIESSVTIHAKLKEALSEVQNQATQLHLKSKEIEELEWKNKKFEHRITQLEKVEEELNEMINKIKKESGANQVKLEDNIRDLTYQLESKEKELLTLQSTLSQVKSDYEKRISDLERSKDESQNITKSILANEKIEQLQKVIAHLKNELIETREAEVKRKFNHILPPLKCRNVSQSTDQSSSKLNKALDDVTLALANPKIIDLSNKKVKPIEQLESLRFREKNLKKSLKNIRNEAIKDVKQKLSLTKKSDFNLFSNVSLTKSIGEILAKDKKPIAKLKIPTGNENITEKPIQLNVSWNDFITVHSQIVI